MAYSAIEQIKVGSNPSGQAFGGYIFNATMTIGFAAHPTELTISIASSSGAYTISESDLRLDTTPTTITLGDMVLKMFPVKYNISKNSNDRVLTIKYVDLSKCLDRIFVGLLNEHTRRDVKPLLLEAQVPVSCPSCDGTPYNRQINYTALRNVDSLGLDGTIQQLKRKKIGYTRVTASYAKNGDANALPAITITKNDPSFSPVLSQYQYDLTQQPTIDNTLMPDTITGYTVIASSIVRDFVSYFDLVPVSTNLTNPPLIIGDLVNGGFIGIGTEEFNQSSCGTGPVSYSLKELKRAIRQMGITFLKIADIDSIPDGSNQIRRNYAGSLRNVLENWGREYGFTFTYDFAQHQIIGIDLRTPIVDLDDVKAAILSADSISDDTSIANSAIIESFDEEVSIEETYRKYHATSYKRDRKVKNFNRTIYNRAYFSRLSLADVMDVPKGFEILASPYDSLYIACILACTFNYRIWLDYLENIGVVSRWNNLTNDFSTTAAPSGQQYQHIAKSLGISLSDYQVNLLKSQSSKPDISDWFFEEIYNTHKSIGQSFLNQFYANTAYEPFHSECCRPTGRYNIDAAFSQSVETIHSKNAFVQNCITTPVLNGINTFPTLPPQSYTQIFGHYSNLLKGAQTILNEKFSYGGITTYKALNIFNRTGSYRILADIIDRAKSTELGTFPVSDANAMTFINNQITFMVSALKNDPQKITLNINNRINSDEQLVRPESTPYECIIQCEEDIVGQACNPTRCTVAGQRVDKQWEEGLLSLSCDELVITLGRNAPDNIAVPKVIRILPPSNGGYLLNYIYKQNTSYIIPGTKQVKEKLDTLPGNVANIDFGVVDATSDLDAYFDNDGNVITNVYVPEQINGRNIVTLDQYDAKIRENESIVEVSVDKPRKALSFSVPGILPQNKIQVNAQSILTPAQGLIGMDINWSEKGLTSTYKFSTRPPVLPGAIKDLTFNRVGIKAIL